MNWGERMGSSAITLSVTAVLSHVAQGTEEILFVREGRGKKKGCWNLPSGRPRPGECLEGAAVRELLEETGVRGEIVGLIGVYTYLRKPGHRLVRVVFAAHPTDRTINGVQRKVDGKEILDTAWLSVSEAKRLISKKEADWWRPAVLQRILADCADNQIVSMHHVHEWKELWMV